MKEQLIKNYQKITNASFLDGLTGLYNHGIFQVLLDEEINRAKRYDTPFTLALIDIDSFSFYNKQHNPALADLALKKVAELIKKNLRTPDLASRYSGNVFAVIMPNSTVSSAFSALERIRNSVEKSTLDNLTISAGLSSYPKDASNKEKLIFNTQKLLLKAKANGKNKVCFINEEIKPVVEQRFKIMIVDDEPLNLKLMEAVLAPFNYDIFKAYNGQDALAVMKKADIDLVLLDVMMPYMDGYEVCRRLKDNEETRLVPIIMVTALNDTEAKIKGIKAGADDFITKPPNKIELTARIKSLLKVNTLNKKLTSIENVLISMANAVEAKDPYTKGHIQRVSDMAVKLGKKMELSAIKIDALRLGGILHDIGKIGVPREILNKQAPLDPDEWEIIKSHPATGYGICLPLKKSIGPALDVIRHHHEKLDGSGYPDAIKGEEISVLARIMAVVDIFDALNTDRPYRRGLPMEKAFKILCKETNEGKLDKAILRHLLEMKGACPQDYKITKE